MNRRQMVILPGVALAASRGFSQTQQPAATSSGSGSLSRKAIARYSRSKTAYTVPRSAAKQAKYISFLTTLLTLSPGQQTEAAGIFSAAATSDAELKKTIKAHRQSLGAAVSGNDSASIARTSAAIGRVAASRHSIGAKANAAFLQILTADQQAKYSQFKS